MSWDGPERRKDNNIEFKHELLRRLEMIDYQNKALNEKIEVMASRIEHANNNTKQLKVFIDQDLSDLQVAIQGDEASGIIGIASKLKTITSEFADHLIQDRWAYGVMITILVSMLGVTLFKK